MAAHTYVQAYCSKSRQHYRLTLEGTEVVAFSLLSDAAAPDQAAPRPLNPQPVYTASPQLRACPRCGQRQVSNCLCLNTALNCEAGIGYRFPCLYCRELTIVNKTGK